MSVLTKKEQNSKISTHCFEIKLIKGCFFNPARTYTPVYKTSISVLIFPPVCSSKHPCKEFFFYFNHKKQVKMQLRKNWTQLYNKPKNMVTY